MIHQVNPLKFMFQNYFFSAWKVNIHEAKTWECESRMPRASTFNATVFFPPGVVFAH